MNLVEDTTNWLNGIVANARNQRADMVLKRDETKRKIQEVDAAIAKLDEFLASGMITTTPEAPKPVKRHAPKGVHITQSRARAAEARVLRALRAGPQKLSELVTMTGLPKSRGYGLLSRMKYRKNLVHSDNNGMYVLSTVPITAPTVHHINYGLRSFIKAITQTTPRTIPEILRASDAKGLGFTLGAVSGVVRRMVESGKLTRHKQNDSVTYIHT